MLQPFYMWKIVQQNLLKRIVMCALHVRFYGRLYICTYLILSYIYIYVCDRLGEEDEDEQTPYIYVYIAPYTCISDVWCAPHPFLYYI